MPSFTTESQPDGCRARIARLKRAVQNALPGVCTERAVIWTRYHQNTRNRRKAAPIQMAEALRAVLQYKQLTIYPDELLVGNFSSKRVGGAIYPELHGIPMLEDLYRFPHRRTNPLQITRKEQWRLLRIVPFWLRRFLAYRVYASPLKRWRFIWHQLQGRYYLINESGGIAHLAPDYATLIDRGTDGIVAQAEEGLARAAGAPEKVAFYRAVKIIAEGLAQFGARYAQLAQTMAERESDAARRGDLAQIAAVCRRVPRHPAATFQEALQSILLAQIVLNLESLDNAICPGRIDQYLYPIYVRDRAAGNLSPERAWELAAAFCIKLSEIVPVFSERLTRFHGGLFNGQVITVGGQTPEGEDATNELSYLFLDVIDTLRMRQPNFHARVHPASPAAYRSRITEMLASGGNTPALYNDSIIIAALQRQGYRLQDARDYTAVGCVEPVSQGKSFASTDAALVNVPIALELALNAGKRFGALRRTGLATPPPAQLTTMAAVQAAFESQLRYQISRLIADLRAVEGANRRLHPTPLTSMLLAGCLESGTCATAGGARYNASGIQCVGPVDAGDALHAIEQIVFAQKRLSLAALVRQLRHNLPDPALRTALLGTAKFGNDVPAADRWTVYVVDTFTRLLADFTNTRGGPYTTGLYSVTAHVHFGQQTGALPHGRLRGAAFASGIAPGNGCDRQGPTALINSINRLDYTRTANGVNFNIKFDPHTLRGQTGRFALQSLIQTYFRRGGMQLQINVLDPQVLREARDNPQSYPHLLVRVSGYSAYFNDLTPAMQDEIIRRSSLTSVSQPIATQPAS
jgi:pyruvate formate-lyase/glycerol dehydratase family glycyl radical enzyme